MSYINEFLLQQSWSFPENDGERWFIKKYLYTDDKGNDIYKVHYSQNELELVKLYEELTDKENVLKRFKGVK